MEAVAGAIGSAFLNSTVDLLVQKLGSPLVQYFFKRRKLNEGLLEKLAETLNSVNGLLTDAEEKEITVAAVKNWLDDVKDAVYEAEDLLDEIDYEVQRSEMEAGGPQSSTDRVRELFSSLNPFNKKEKEEMAEKLENIFQRLERLGKIAHSLHLIRHVGERSPLQSVPTTSRLGDTRVIGRDDAQKSIINMLLSDDAKGKSLEVILIVGMGGIGKTTLAKFVYNDSNVQEWFDLKTWVHVSQEFDVLKLTKDILKEVGSSDCDSMTANQLHCELEKKLMGNKLLLVLDDVWSADQAKWDFLLTPLKSGARGSKIVMTTRDTSVASALQSVSPYHLKEMSDDDCWLLFSEHAFSGQNFNKLSQFEEMFRPEILRRCGGLPLAARSLGSLLKCETDSGKWSKILKSNLWDLQNDTILPALRVSYYYLPSHLKRCFAYCAILPKGCFFTKMEIIQFWMAEGFIVPVGGNNDMEEAGCEFFKELVSRSFFEQSDDASPDFFMHDLTNDLAKFVSGKFSFSLYEDDSVEISTKTRYLSYCRTINKELQNFAGIDEARNLRTLLTLEERNGDLNYENIHKLLPGFKRLRVLALAEHTDTDQLLDSIGTLKHLRYLDLSWIPIRRLPENVCTLYNLQTLILHKCNGLVNLPANMMKLTNLYHLDIMGTSLKEMPPQMSRLTKLKTLTDFFVGKQNSSSIKELGELKCLQGELHICNLQNVVDSQDALVADLKGKKNLKKLKLSWTGRIDDSLHARGLLDRLQPHTGVEVVSIHGYEGTKFPNWVGDSIFSNLVSLKLKYCCYCSTLPPLGKLSSLKKLWIEGFPEVVTVGSEFYGSCPSSSNPFQSLETLTFNSMPQWCEWIPNFDENRGKPFPRLQVLRIKNCPNLTALLNHLPSLKKLQISYCPQLVLSRPSSPTINEITLKSWPSDWFSEWHLEKLPSGLHSLTVETQPFASGMQSLTVDSVPNLSTILTEMEQLGYFPSILEEIVIEDFSLRCFPLKLFPNLKQLYIKNCSYLESLCAQVDTIGDSASICSLEICECPNLEVLSLSHCSNLKLVHCIFPSLVELEVHFCEELESFPGLRRKTSSSKLESLELHSCKKLFADCRKWELQRLPSLSFFYFGGCGEVESFPADYMLLPPALTSLVISNLRCLKSLDYKQFHDLTSIRELEIRECPELQSLPEEGLPSSLTYLFIRSCPLLEQRCQKVIGEDWPKISHIPKIHIGEDWSRTDQESDYDDEEEEEDDDEFLL